MMAGPFVGEMDEILLIDLVFQFGSARPLLPKFISCFINVTSPIVRAGLGIFVRECYCRKSWGIIGTPL